MPLSSHEYRTTLVNKILLATSQEEVKRSIDTALKTSGQNKPGSQLIALFIEKIISDLEVFNPLEKDAFQWSNIKFARIQLNRIKNNLTETVS